jgi:hypothetical protein
MFWDGAPGPNVLLVTTRVITIIEGRRAASNEAESPAREALRLLRNLDALYDMARGRFLSGLFIVEEDNSGVEALEALGAACHTVVANPRTLTKWLPHRQPAQRREIAGALLGVTSWQRVCRELAVPWSALPDSVLDVPLEARPADDEPLDLEAGEERSVVVGRDLDDALEAHRLRLAQRANTRFPPTTLTDAARRALANFYRSPAWRALREASANGVFPARRTHAATGRWRFVLQRDAKLQAAIEWHADLLDGTWDDAVDDALFRYCNRPPGRPATRAPRSSSTATRGAH